MCANVTESEQMLAKGSKRAQQGHSRAWQGPAGAYKGAAGPKGAKGHQRAPKRRGRGRSRKIYPPIWGAKLGRQIVKHGIKK